MANRLPEGVYAYTTAKGDGLYRAVWRGTGNQQTSKRGFRTQAEAKQFRAKKITEVAENTYVKPVDARALVRDLALPWMATKEAVLKRSAYVPLEASLRNYVLPKWGDRAVSSIKHSEVQEWVNGITKSHTVVSRAYGILAGILDVAERDKRITSNPARGVKLPRKSSAKTRRYLTHEELWTVAEKAGERKPLVLTLGYCGLRWGELVALRVRDIDFLRRRISITRNVVETLGEFNLETPKTHEARQVPVPTAVLAELSAACAGKGRDDLVFSNSLGGYIRRTRASVGSKSWWLTALKSAGVERLVLHDLRHTAASLAVSSGANVKAIQRMLGHASAAMTLDTYADLFDDDLEALVDRLDLAIETRVVVKSVAKN